MLLAKNVPARILVHLSAALALSCKGTATPDPALVTPTATATATATASPTATAIATATSTTTAIATVASSPAPVACVVAPPIPKAIGTGGAVAGAECGSDADCAKGLFCWRNFTGAGFTKDPGHCNPGRPIYEGRPLVVDGEPRVARRETGSAWRGPDERWAATALELEVDARCHLAAQLRAAAFEEHASVAAFARTICELVALGAPSWLVAATSEALSDEVRHAEATFTWYTAVSGDALAPGALTEATAPLRSGAGAREALLRDVFRGGCVGETLAACRAAEHAEDAPGGLCAFYTQIAEDEARHAALAFRTALWLRDEGSLAGVLEDEIARFHAAATPGERATLAPLFAALEPRVEVYSTG